MVEVLLCHQPKRLRTQEPVMPLNLGCFFPTSDPLCLPAPSVNHEHNVVTFILEANKCLAKAP